MMEERSVYGVVGAVLVGLVSLAVWWRLSRGPGWTQLLQFGARKLPPVQGGWLPWLGCALSFGKQPLHYINITHKKVCTLIKIIHAISDSCNVVK